MGDDPDPAFDGARATLRVKGRPASLMVAGEGPPVVLVHGLGLSADVWRPHLAALAGRGYAAIAPDLPGFGETRGPATGLSVPATAAWLTAFADGLGLTAAAWVGHSISVQPLLRLAADDPDRARALVLAAPTGRRGSHRLRQLVGLLRTAPRESPGLVVHVLRQYLRRGLPAIGTWVRAQSHDALADARRVTAPSLVVLGGRDPVVPEPFGERLAATLGRGRLERIEGAAHAVALDPFPPFRDALCRFLDEVYRSRSTSDRWKSSGMFPKFHGSPGP